MGYSTPLFDSLKKEDQELIKKHLDLVIQKNKELNLTRIDNEEEGMLLHVEDSLTSLPDMENAPEGLYGDMGSGAGFPGIPLAVATGRKTILIDARQKKMIAVQEMIDALGLTNRIGTYAGRAELLARKEAGSFSVLTARALSNLPVLLELAQPLLSMGGHLICYKSHMEEDELSEADRVAQLLGMKLVSDRDFMIGDEYDRRIIVFEKCRKSKVKLPRLEGQAQKKPL